MAIHDFSAQRLFIEASFEPGATLPCTKDQAHYLIHVLRLENGADILVFNGTDGEWRARVQTTGKRTCSLNLLEQTRAQVSGPDVALLFAPLKRARLDYLVQKATELGVGRLSPVMTRHTVPDRVNLARMRANAIEAAEQCGILRVPDVDTPRQLSDAVSALSSERALVFCDERAEVSNPINALSSIKRGTPVAVLTGPEGGFAPDERAFLLDQPTVHPISLGPRVMRADTAAIAVLALVNAVIGDWH